VNKRHCLGKEARVEKGLVHSLFQVTGPLILLSNFPTKSLLIF
jgi:hypothetical protein